MDCSARPIVRALLLLPVTPDSGDKFVSLTPPTLSPCMDLIRQTRRQFRGVGRRNLYGLTSGISVNPTPLHQTERLAFLRDPLAPLLAHTSLTNADILPNPIIHLVRKSVLQPRPRSGLVCAPSPDLHLPSIQQSFVIRKAVPRLLLQRSFRTIF